MKSLIMPKIGTADTEKLTHLIPNKKNDNGMSAAIGMFRPNTLIGAKNAFTQGKQPHKTPSGIATTAAKAKPSTTRRKLTNRFRVSV